MQLEMLASQNIKQLRYYDYRIPMKLIWNDLGMWLWRSI